jgi:ribosomal protein S1
MEIDAVILAIDAERELISIGIKQIEKDPFSAYQPSSVISRPQLDVSEMGKEHD